MSFCGGKSRLGLAQKLIDIFHWANRVVPVGSLGVMLQVNLFHLSIANANPLLILFGMKGGADFETSRSFGSTDKFQCGFIIGQRLCRPVITDKGKQAVLDRIPF